MFDFPEHNNNYVFSKSDEYTFFIYCNKGITRCGTYEELHKSWPYNEYTDKIPQSYDVIHLAEKLALIESGNIIWVNKKENNYKDSEYMIINSNEERVRAVVNTKGECIDFGHDGWTADYDEALNIAVKLSENVDFKQWFHPLIKRKITVDDGKQMQYMVCRHLDMFNWH